MPRLRLHVHGILVVILRRDDGLLAQRRVYPTFRVRVFARFGVDSQMEWIAEEWKIDSDQSRVE